MPTGPITKLVADNRVVGLSLTYSILYIVAIWTLATIAVALFFIIGLALGFLNAYDGALGTLFSTITDDILRLGIPFMMYSSGIAVVVAVASGGLIAVTKCLDWMLRKSPPWVRRTINRRAGGLLRSDR